MRHFFKNCRAWALAGMGLLWLACGSLQAATELSFDAANKLYEEGKFAEAARSYENLIAHGQTSAAVYFNLGNALFKDHQIGRAILNYRQAERLSPRDPDLRANLQFARNAANGGDGTVHKGWHRWLAEYSVNEWTAATMVMFWLCFGLLTAGQLQPGWKKRLRPFVLGSGLTTLLLGIALLTVWCATYETESGVVTAKEAVVRYGPLEESQSFYTLHDGMEITVLDTKDNWLQVEDARSRVGWVKRDQVQRISPKS